MNITELACIVQGKQRTVSKLVSLTAAGRRKVQPRLKQAKAQTHQRKGLLENLIAGMAMSKRQHQYSYTFSVRGLQRK